MPRVFCVNSRLPWGVAASTERAQRGQQTFRPLCHRPTAFSRLRRHSPTVVYLVQYMFMPGAHVWVHARIRKGAALCLDYTQQMSADVTHIHDLCGTAVKIPMILTPLFYTVVLILLHDTPYSQTKSFHIRTRDKKAGAETK